MSWGAGEVFFEEAEEQEIILRLAEIQQVFQKLFEANWSTVNLS